MIKMLFSVWSDVSSVEKGRRAAKQWHAQLPFYPAIFMAKIRNK